MTIERAVEDISSMLGGLDIDKQTQLTAILSQLASTSYEDGFDTGQAAKVDYIERDFEEGED